MRNGYTTGHMEKEKSPAAPPWIWKDAKSGLTYTDNGRYIGHDVNHPCDIIALNESDPEESHEVTREDIKEQLADAFRPDPNHDICYRTFKGADKTKPQGDDLPDVLPNVGMVTVSTSEYLEMQNLIKLQKHKIDLLTERIELIKKHLS